MEHENYCAVCAQRVPSGDIPSCRGIGTCGRPIAPGMAFKRQRVTR